jgi:hypothetical protein
MKKSLASALSALLPAFAHAHAATLPEGVAGAARALGVRACLGTLETVEKTLLAGREYSVRGFADPKEPDASPFSAIVDSRKPGTRDRWLLNLTVFPVGSPAKRCAVIFEQTQHHERRCEDVLAQLAPKAPASAAPSLGAVTVDVSRHLTVTVIPAGAAHCVSVVKEAAF